MLIGNLIYHLTCRNKQSTWLPVIRSACTWTNYRTIDYSLHKGLTKKIDNKFFTCLWKSGPFFLKGVYLCAIHFKVKW